MADNNSNSQTQQARPPAGGAQDHDAMRAASMRPVRGPAATDNLAATGGLSVPGGDPNGSTRIDVPTAAHVHEPIPGERDPGNITHRQPGAVSGAFNGETNPDDGPTMADETRQERAREGGDTGRAGRGR